MEQILQNVHKSMAATNLFLSNFIKQRTLNVSIIIYAFLAFDHCYCAALFSSLDSVFMLLFYWEVLWLLATVLGKGVPRCNNKHTS